jgi:hypothetical protein
MTIGMQTPLQCAVQALSAILAETTEWCQFCGARRQTGGVHKPSCVTHFARLAIERSKETPLAERDPWALADDVASMVRLMRYTNPDVDPAEVARLRIVKLLTNGD